MIETKAFSGDANGMRDGGQFNLAAELAKPAKVQGVDREALRELRIFTDGSDKEAQIAISAYKNLRTRVMLKMKEIGTNSLMVAGTAQNVGKTLTSINIAVALARRSGKQVLLVDMDLRSPSVHHLFGVKPVGNIVDVAEGRCTLSEALIDPQINSLLILPGTKRVEDSSEAMISDNMQRLFEELKALDDIIIVFDTPPVLGCDDVAAVAPYLDACLFVVNERSTSKKELETALQMIADNVELVGIAINRSSEGNFSNYYY